MAVILRVFLLAMPTLQVDWSLLFWVLAVLTMTIGNLVAIAQANLKRMLAYSTIAHMGYLLIGPVVGSQLGVAAVLFYSLTYALMTIGAFGMVILLQRGTVRGDQIDDFTGLAQKSPLSAAVMLLFLLSLTGIPPTAGFVGKFYLFAAAVEAGYIWLVLIAVVTPPSPLLLHAGGRSDVHAGSPREQPEHLLTLRVALLLAAAGTFSLHLPPILSSPASRPGSPASHLSSGWLHPAPGRSRRLTRGRPAWHTFPHGRPLRHLARLPQRDRAPRGRRPPVGLGVQPDRLHCPRRSARR
jgi:NADH-quinone oxidoreductase subunit N